MSKRTKFLLGIGVIAALVIGWQVAAFAVHAEVFQLEGNAVTDDPPLPPAPASAVDDWENVVGPNGDGGLSDETAFVAEPNPATTFFTGGGSKDPQDIPNWLWKNDTGGLPDKANIRDSFAASYTFNGKELLYFGADRFDGSGDAAIAFWFLQDEVALDPTPPASGTASGDFTGQHQEGDVLVISNFSNGGTVGTMTVYKWDPSCTKAANNNPQAGQCGAANLRVVETSTNADCSALAPTALDDACAVVNTSTDTATVPWEFRDKSGSTTYLPGEFFEGGIDLTALDLDEQCFATALAETRTSTSPTSTLKDFTVGKFGSCESGIDTHPVLASDGSAIPAGGVTAGTAVKDSATITVSGTTTWTGTLQFFLCEPDELDANNLCSTGGTQVGSDQTVTQATTQPILSAAVTPSGGPGKYCFRGVFTSGTTGVPNSTDATEDECFTVRQPTSVDTIQRWTPNDTATVTPAGTAGTVEFKLYDNGNCTAPAIYTESDGSAPFATTNTTFRTDSTTVSWQATFTPTNTNIDPSTGVCETTQVTLDNDGP